MAECILMKNGGGVTSDDLTATAAVVAAGYKYQGADTNDDIGTGTAPLKAATTHYALASAQTVVPAGTFCSGAQSIAAVSATNYSAGNIKKGVTIAINNGNTNIGSVTGTGVMVNQLSTKTRTLNFTNNLMELTATFDFATKMVGVTQIEVIAKSSITGWYEVGVGEGTASSISGQTVKLRCSTTDQTWTAGGYVTVKVTAVGY